MKAVLIVHNAAVDGEVMELLQLVGVDCYTKFTQTLGSGKLSEPHLDSPVWPGKNYATFVVTESARAEELMEKVRHKREELGSEGLKAFVWHIEDIT